MCSQMCNDHSTLIAVAFVCVSLALHGCGSIEAGFLQAEDANATMLNLDGEHLSLAIEHLELDEEMTFELTLKKDSWLGIGFSVNDSLSMSADGKGVDAFLCPQGASGGVERWWITSYSPPGATELFANANCSSINGSTVLKFTRSIHALSDQQRALIPGAAQQIIYAFGADGAKSVGVHSGGYGATKIVLPQAR